MVSILLSESRGHRYISRFALLISSFPNRRIFIIEGLATVVVGIVLPFILLDYPDTASFMTDDERTFYARRIKADYNIGAEDGDKFRWHYLRAALFDWKIHLGFLVSLANGISGYGYGLTLHD